MTLKERLESNGFTVNIIYNEKFNATYVIIHKGIDLIHNEIYLGQVMTDDEMLLDIQRIIGEKLEDNYNKIDELKLQNHLYCYFKNSFY